MVDGDESTTVSITGPIGRGCSIRIIGAAGTMELEDLEPKRSGAVEPDLLLELAFLSRGLRTLPISDMVGGAEVEPLFLAQRIITVGPYAIILLSQLLRKRNTTEIYKLGSYSRLYGDEWGATD